MFFSEKKNQFKTFSRRSFFLLIIKLILFFFVGLRLFNIQITQSEKYRTLSKNNRISLKIIFPKRGKITDRNNNTVAKNYDSYELYVIPEEVENLESVLLKLNKIVNIPFSKRKKIILLSRQVKKFEMIKILDNLSWKHLEQIEANMIDFPGIHLLLSSKRKYPFGENFSHILGYVSKPNKDELSLPYISSMPSLEIGKSGVEKHFNQLLIGKAGKREVEVNSIGREIREISKTESIEGGTLSLSIDLRLQRYVYEILKEHRSGSIVVMKVSTGEILSMTSVPSFDPNKIITIPNKKYWDTILKNELSPLTNRAVQGLYAPGSTFKMVVAIAALEKNIINSNFFVICAGKIEFGDKIYHCWKTKGHGKVDLTKGIVESCDCFFYELAKKIGIDNISIMAKEFGLGDLTGIEVPSEKNGIVPNKRWKKQQLNENWYAGETLITGIGQGYILATPLQLANMAAIIANKGKLIKPTLIKSKISNDISGTPNKLNISKDNFSKINIAMEKVVNNASGTAFRSRSNKNDYTFAGKTGTSQVKRITIEEREQEDFRKKEIEWKNKDHSLFVGYMPVNNPQYAASVVIEHGGSGASVAAPIAKKIFDKLYKLGI